LNAPQRRAVDAKIDALPKAVPVMDGKYAVDKRAQALAELNEEQESIMTQGATALMNLRDRFDADLADAMTPKGDDLSNPDYILIRDGLIDSPVQLKPLLTRYDNIAFARAAQNYANARDWEGFDETVITFAAIAESMKDFGKTHFDLCGTAVYHPEGMAVMQIAEEGGITRLAINYGIRDNLIN